MKPCSKPIIQALGVAFNLLFLATVASHSAETNDGSADRLLADYFRTETSRLSERCIPRDVTLTDWTSNRALRLAQLQEMLGLSPMPERADLRPVITGKVEHERFTVENLHFQSSPGLYVTANLYIPKNVMAPAPTILYVCGHGPVIKDGISFGNKVAYQHHGAWFAESGYVCLIIDTLQLGEIQGLHHGTYREGMWWWNSRGYTPAGIEAWNSIRAIDYLSTRPEVDTNRFGITGRSGGGAYSWTTAALDDRIKVVAPVAGITDLQNYVVDGTVEGHCDCMFFVNTWRWDYPQLAAMIVPRPLLIGNSDKDTIFPLDGVQRLHEKVRSIYRQYGAATNLGLLITEGPHKDTQDLQLPVLRWFNRFLKGEDVRVETAAHKYFEPEQLKVFPKLPEDQINTHIQESFVVSSPAPSIPESKEQWREQRDGWLAALREKCFAGWPEDPPKLELQMRCSEERDGLRLRTYDFVSQAGVPLRLYLIQSAPTSATTRVVLRIPDAEQWNEWLEGMSRVFGDELSQERFVSGRVNPQSTVRSAGTNDDWIAKFKGSLSSNRWAIAIVPPRGVGLTAWSGDAKKQIQIRRRFMLLGQTLDSMRVWDIRRAIETVRSIDEFKKTPLWLEARRDMAVDVLYASLFEPDIAGLDLSNLPVSHSGGPDYLNVMRVLDIPQAMALAMERSIVHVSDSGSARWEYSDAVSRALEWDKSEKRY